MLAHHAHAHANDTCHTSAAWAHKSDPIRDRKISDGVAFLMEIGGDPNETLSGKAHISRTRRVHTGNHAVVVVQGARGQCLAFLQQLQLLVEVTKPKVGVQFFEQSVMLAANAGGEVDDDGVCRFADSTICFIRKDGAMATMAAIMAEMTF